MNGAKLMWDTFCKTRDKKYSLESIKKVKTLPIKSAKHYYVRSPKKDVSRSNLNICEIVIDVKGKDYTLIRTDFIDSWETKDGKDYSLNHAWLTCVNKKAMLQALKQPIPWSETSEMGFEAVEIFEVFLKLFDLEDEYEMLLKNFYDNGGKDEDLYEVEDELIHNHYGMYYLYMDALNHMADNKLLLKIFKEQV